MTSLKIRMTKNVRAFLRHAFPNIDDILDMVTFCFVKRGQIRACSHAKKHLYNEFVVMNSGRLKQKLQAGENFIYPSNGTINHSWK